MSPNSIACLRLVCQMYGLATSKQEVNDGYRSDTAALTTTNGQMKVEKPWLLQMVLGESTREPEKL